MNSNKDKEPQTVSIWIDPRSIIFEKNPRTRRNSGFTPQKMERLRKGIQKDGLNHALLVKVSDDGHVLIAGERRLRAIRELIEMDDRAKANDAARVLCKNPRNKRMEPASEVYKTVECKISDTTDEKEIRRQRIQENTLHEPLTDYELLLQVEEMAQAGFTRTEQAETMDISEAWISQSHSLLACPPKILELMESEKLSRTAAITFLPLEDDWDSAVRVAERATKMFYDDAEKKEREATAIIEEAKEEMSKNEDILTVTKFTRDGDSAGTLAKARRAFSRASNSLSKAEKARQQAQKQKEKQIPVETIHQAAAIEGVGDKIRRPQSMKHIRIRYKDVGEMIEKEGVDPATEKKYDINQLGQLHKFLGWVLNTNDVGDPLEVLDPVG